MLVKVILVFLLGMALVGMIGKALFPGKVDRMLQRRSGSKVNRRMSKAPVCPKCGRYMIGSSGCDCEKV